VAQEGGFGALFMIILSMTAFAVTIYLSITLGISALLSGDLNGVIILLISVFPVFFIYRMVADYLIERKKFPKELMIEEFE
jgi:hypothetical protein